MKLELKVLLPPAREGEGHFGWPDRPYFKHVIELDDPSSDAIDAALDELKVMALRFFADEGLKREDREKVQSFKLSFVK